MRTIKFRGKEIGTGFWVFGSYVEYTPAEGESQIKAIVDWKGNWRYINPSTVGQFTGLHDKNGKGIYEGDKLLCYHDQYEQTIEAVVFFDNATFMLYQILSDGTKKAYRYWNDGIHDWYSMEQFDSFELEIIGKIHDNPELLNEQQ